jgi:hypothetical protein
MYGENQAVGAYIGMNEQQAKQVAMRRLESTMRQNIDEQIAGLQAQIKTLEETKTRLESSGILDTRIDDIQRAMRF